MTAPSWAWIGASSGSATSASPSYPASGVVAGDAVFLAVLNKATTGSGEPPAVAAPSGWTQVTAAWGGSGSAGVDTGPVKVTLHRRAANADGTENGTTLTGLVANPSGSSFVFAMLFGVRPVTVGDTFTLASGSGADTTAGTAFSVTAGTDPGIRTDDLVLGLCGFDVGTTSAASAEGIASPGATIGAVTERRDSSTAAGNSCRAVVVSAACTSGASTGAPTLTATSAANVTGVGVVVRIRESAPVTGAASLAGQTALAASGRATTVGAVAVSAGTALAASARLTVPASATVGAASTLASTGRLTVAGAAALAAGTSLGSGGRLTIGGASALAARAGIATAAVTATPPYIRGTATAGQPAGASARAGITSAPSAAAAPSAIPTAKGAP